jgi:hypothetical protein
MAAGEGFKEWQTGDVLTANDVNGYLNQGIWVFDDAADRTAQVTSPQEGNFAYLRDDNKLYYYTGSAWAEADTSGIQPSEFAAKGDILAGTGASTFDNLGVGANGTVLTADSTETTGLKWVAPAGGGGGLTFIKSQTIGSSVNTVTVSDAFSATYDNYLIQLIGSDGSADGMELSFRLGATTSNYYSSLYLDRATTATVSTIRKSNASSAVLGIFGNTDDSTLNLYVFSPNLAKRTSFSSFWQASEFSGWAGGQLRDTTAYTAFTILLVDPGAATFSGGTIRVYGYQNS